MSRQNIAKPRIFINIPEYLSATGTSIDPLFRTLPVTPNTMEVGYAHYLPGSGEGAITITNPYIAILRHTMNGKDMGVYSDAGSTTVSTTSIINGDFGSQLDGFSIFSTVADAQYIKLISPSNDEWGSLIYGSWYDFPVSPDMKLTLEYEYKGRKEIESKGGHSLSNTFYSGPPDWGQNGAWELGGGTTRHVKSGRRIWTVSFSFMTESSIWPEYAHLQTNQGGGAWVYNNHFMDDDSLQRMIHFTQGGQIPFIWCSDGDNIRQDNLVIAKFDMKTFKLTQKSFSTYSIKFKIREVW